MKRFLCVAVLTLLPMAAAAHERAGNAVLGALAGAVVFGPVGAVAGAAVGYTAGHGIAPVIEAAAKEQHCLGAHASSHAHQRRRGG